MELAQAALGPALADRYATFLAQVSQECPLIAILGGELLQRGNISPAELANTQDFQTRVFDGLLREAQPVEDAFGKTAVDDILQMLALLAPVQPTADFKERVARLLGSPWTGDRVSKVLDALNDAGLLLVTGAGVRVTPDLLSDHLAYKACYDRQGKASGFAARLIEEFSPEQFPVMLQHLTEAEWRAVQEHDSTDSVVEPLWQWFSQRFQGSSFYNQLNHLMSLFASPVKSSVVTEYPSFVRGLLKKARTFGRETYDQIFLDLRSHATSHPYSTSAGEPDTEWKKLLEAIERRTQEFSADPDLGQLYSQIADDERSRMEYMRGSERTALGME
jgi:hypothetical protein